MDRLARPFLLTVTAALTVLALVPPATASAAVPNDDRASASEVTALPASFEQDVAGATVAADDPSPGGPECRVVQPTNTVWFSHVADEASILDIDTDGSDYETMVAVFVPEHDGLRQVGCNVLPASPEAQRARVRVATQAGQTSLVMVGAAGEWALESGSTLHVSFAASSIPLLGVDVTVDPVAVWSPRTGTVTVRGTAMCSRDAWFVADGHVRQPRAETFLLAEPVSCLAGEVTPWEATSMSGGRRAHHRQGEAEVYVVLYASDDTLDRAHPEAWASATVVHAAGGGR